MFVLYILRTPGNLLYVSVTHNLDERIKRHTLGQGAEFTRRNKVDKVIYVEKFTTLVEARRRERQIKGWRREKKENLIKYGKP